MFCLENDRERVRRGDKRWRAARIRCLVSVTTGRLGDDIVSCAVGAVIYRSSGRPTRTGLLRPVSASADADPIKA